METEDKNPVEGGGFGSPEQTGSEDADLEAEKDKKNHVEEYSSFYKTEVGELTLQWKIGHREKKVNKIENNVSKEEIRVDSIAKSIESLEKSIEKIESILSDNDDESLRDSLEEGKVNLEKELDGLNERKEKSQEKLEKEKEKLEEALGNRNEAIDIMLDVYNEKLKPIEEEIVQSKAREEELKVIASDMKVKHDRQREILKSFRKEQRDLEKSLKLAGVNFLKRRSILSKIRSSQEEIADKIKEDEESIKSKQRDIRDKIRDAEKRVSVYQKEKKYFQSIRDGEPSKTDKEESGADPKEKKETGETSEKEKPFPINDLVKKWNKHIEERSEEEKTHLTIEEDIIPDIEKFADGEKELTLKDFKEFISKRISMDHGNKEISDVLEEIFKTFDPEN